MRRLALASALLTACVGGTDPSGGGGEVVFEPGKSFWSLPLPSDLRREDDGTANLDKWPGVWRPNELVEMWLGVADRRLAGRWGVSSAVFFTTDVELDPATLPPTPEATLLGDATAFLLDVDPASPERGRRFPLWVEFRAKGDTYSPDRVLSLTPVFGFVRRPNTRYAAVVTTGIRDTTGAPIGRSVKFDELFEQGDHFADLKATLAAEEFELVRVAGATIFTTVDHEALLRKVAAFSESLPQPTLTASIGVGRAYESYQVFTTRFEVPVVQNGAQPYRNLGEGQIQFAADDRLQIVRTESVDLVLTVPRSRMPARGFPLTIYLHGSGGNRWEPVERAAKEEIPDAPAGEFGRGPAEWLARRGVATLALDFPMHGRRGNPPDTTGLIFYNLFGNVDATIDNFHVAILELLLLSRLASVIQISPALAPGVLDPGGAPALRFDGDRLSGMGQSMGTTLGVAWATVDPRVERFVFSGAGGVLAEIAVTAHEPIELKPFVERLLGLTEVGAELDVRHPVLHAFQNLWDLADPVPKAHRVTKSPWPGLTGRDFLMFAGIRDGYFHPRSQAAMAVGLGASFAGEEVEPIVPGALRLAGVPAVGYPVSANLDGRTAAVVEHSAPHELGHYVAFNQPGARYQYTCFLAGDAPKILAPRDDAAPCE